MYWQYHAILTLKQQVPEIEEIQHLKLHAIKL